MNPIVETVGLNFAYGSPSAVARGAVRPVLKDITLRIEKGSTVGIVGESGSGKSTLVRVLCGLLSGHSGSVGFEGEPLDVWLSTRRQDFRRRNQMVFQSPASSFDPRMTLYRSLQEPVRAIERRVPARDEVEGWLTRVGLDPALLGRFPHQLSGGQLQRIAIARALSLSPEVLYADEPTSALDVSVQAKVLNLLMELRAQFGITLVLVSHDLAVVGRICENLIVMRHGEIVEAGPTADILRAPKTDYTRDLIAAADAVSLDGAA